MIKLKETTVHVDARNLEPPEPLVVIIESLAGLPEGAELCAYTDRRPMHLYPWLETRGFRSLAEEPHEGGYVTIIGRV